jgi:hypothetical protein
MKKSDGRRECEIFEIQYNCLSILFVILASKCEKANRCSNRLKHVRSDRPHKRALTIVCLGA